MPHAVHTTDGVRGGAILEFKEGGVVEDRQGDSFVKPGFLRRIVDEAVEKVNRFNEECGGDGRFLLPVVAKYMQFTSQNSVSS